MDPMAATFHAAALHEDLQARGAIVRHPPTDYPWALELRVSMSDFALLADSVFVPQPTIARRRPRGRCRRVPLRRGSSRRWRVSVRARRRSVSVFRPPGRSTVTATTGQPAASARFSIMVVAAKLFVV